MATASPCVVPSGYLHPGYYRTPNFKHTMVVACMMRYPPSVGEYMGISIHGGVGVKGVDLLVVEERLDFFIRHLIHDSVMIQS